MKTIVPDSVSQPTDPVKPSYKISSGTMKVAFALLVAGALAGGQITFIMYFDTAMDQPEILDQVSSLVGPVKDGIIIGATVGLALAALFLLIEVSSDRVNNVLSRHWWLPLVVFPFLIAGGAAVGSHGVLADIRLKVALGGALVGLGLAVLTIMGVKKENRKEQTPN